MKKPKKKSAVEDALQKRNEQTLLKNGFIRCACCKKIIAESDKYCQYCGKPKEIETSLRFR